jgi:predicted RNase H-like HicB family nuclease
MLRYTIILDPDSEEGGYTVTVPALPGCITQGDTLEEAVANAREAITAHLGGYANDDEPIPTEDPGLIVTTVDVSAPVLVSA